MQEYKLFSYFFFLSLMLEKLRKFYINISSSLNYELEWITNLIQEFNGRVW